MQDFIKILREHDELKVIDTPLDIYLEIPHLAYLEVKKPNGGKALLFTAPIDKKNNKKFDIPVLMNVFGSYKRLEIIVGQPIQNIPTHLEKFLHFTPPKGYKAIFSQIKDFFSLRYTLIKQIKSPAPAQEIVYKGNKVDLFDLPILTTWEKDGGPFITMGQVYTQSLDGKKKNLGMYRLQIYDKNHLGLHWQIHKDSHHFFHEYKKAGVKMPVSIAIGGDPLYTWCGQAPLPYGIFELMLYGFIKSKNPKVIKSITNPIYIPYDSDIVIEGWVDTSLYRLEGPFGDHTGFYTPVEAYPMLEVSAITHKKSPVYLATVVGKPPLEDKYMGYLTERVFLPLIQTTSHGLIDYYMPENGVFHNLILAKIDPQYPGHAKQIMHSFWGTGQMSFVKHAIFVDINAPSFTNAKATTEYILNHFSTQNILISDGICDALDHSSPEYGLGGKLGIDATQQSLERDFVLYSDEELLTLIKPLLPEAKILKQYFTQTKNPICIIGVQKGNTSIIKLSKNLNDLQKSLAIVIFVDESKNDLENAYMLIWRISNNIDAKRDITIFNNTIFIDATDKNNIDGYNREWPLETDCSVEVIQKLRQKGLIEGLTEGFMKRFHIYTSPKT
ncbi:menaquinone biosynthesis decarboxylase [Helicobacter cappadocius]|uniref:Menaquinone biosynthesis decarboxylase n=1 Tax=Helicobacter cappadocius TaxID=3063998 RepID=A0AA90TF83_9HELI|nr:MULTISPECIES: menaquinone biosynthesis decarboxylase [unclassified Helicobacter]MDO7253376.1 menaquinone biosynthesis decarboxylase [Helicobacter sp. faydin-H75]MDP2539360.1 menaquinone biosynthesis decarboxylase [Helicobacter sp. faydin-H76]